MLNHSDAPDEPSFRCATCGLRVPRPASEVKHNCPRVGGNPIATRPRFEPSPRLTASPCSHRGDVLESITCRTCGSRGVILEVFACDIHDRCHTERGNDNRAGMDCRICERAGEGFEPAE